MLDLWHSVQSQWRPGFDGPTGLDYAGVRSASDALGLALGPEEFRLLQALEADRLRALDEVRKARVKP